MRPHLNQQLDVVLHACHHSYAGKNKQKDRDSGWPGHKARPYLNKQNKKVLQNSSSDRVAA
jgi:hypothetical protein